MRNTPRGNAAAILIHSLVAVVVFGTLLQYSTPLAVAGTESDRDDLAIALDLATLLQVARTVISDDQNLINNADIGDKGLTGKAVLDKTAAAFQKATGVDPRTLDRGTRRGKLLGALTDSIVDVMNENQKSINHKGIGFKGFVPAVFARLVNEHFSQRIGREAEMTVTAPVPLVRNRTALPDMWERRVIENEVGSAQWPKGRFFAAVAEKDGRKAFRVLVPEYYGAACLSCHGGPKGQIDVTGYPKEGGKEGDLGGAISISLFR
jgi:hypothetical protein